MQKLPHARRRPSGGGEPMPTAYVSKIGLSMWESADTLDPLSHAAATSAAQVAEAVQDQDATWQTLGAHYEGDHESELVDGFFVPVENAARLVVAVEALDAAIVEFADRLRELQSRRTAFEQDVDDFNALYGSQPLEALTPLAQAQRADLAATPAILEGSYQEAAEACAAAVEGIQMDALDVSKTGTGRPGTLGEDLVGKALNKALPLDPRNPSMAAVRLLEVSRVREPWLRFGDVIPETWQARFLGINVGPLGASLHAGAAAVLRAGRTRSSAPLRSMPLAMAMTARNHSNKQTARAMRFADPRGLRRPTWSGFGAKFLDGLPVTGLVRSTRPLWGNRTLANAGKVDPAMESAFRVESRGAFRFNAAVKGLGTVGTVVGAGLTYGDEYERQLGENRAAAPGASRAAVEAEARHDAGAQTAGNVGSTILASAAAGALAGSVLPGPGNVVGFAAGVVSGVAMTVPVADTDGDGQKDSVAEMAGDLAEGAWDWIRGK